MALAVLSAVTAVQTEAAAPARATSGTVLILNSSVTNGSSSVEATEATSLGYSVSVVSAATWDAMTTAQFSSYSAIVLGDPSCGTESDISAAESNVSVWSAAIDGNVTVMGADPDLHASNGQNAAGATKLAQESVAYALQGSGTGADISLSCYFTSAGSTSPTVLSGLGSFRLHGQVGCSDSGHVESAQAQGAYSNLADADLSSWDCSVHEAFTSWPSTFSPLAIDPTATPPSYTGPDHTAGQPYMLVSVASAPLGGAVQGSETWGGGSPSEPCISCQMGAGGVGAAAALASAGSSTSAQTAAAAPTTVDKATGDYYDSETDLSVGGPGVPLSFSRTYDVASAQAGASEGLGTGWAYNLGMHIQYYAPGGDAWITEENGAQLLFTTYTSFPWCVAQVNYCPISPRVIATLNQNADGTWTLTRAINGNEKLQFSSAGALTQIDDQAGDSLSASSESAGQGNCPSGSGLSCTVWTSSVSGQSITLAFDAGELIAAYGATSSDESSFCYYGQTCAPGSGGLSGDLYSATDFAGTAAAVTATYTYDTANSYPGFRHDLTIRTGPVAGTTTSLGYNTLGQVSSLTDPSGAVTEYSYAGDPTEGMGSTTATTYPTGQGVGQPCQAIPQDPCDQVQYQYEYGELVGEYAGDSPSLSPTSVGRDPVSSLASSVIDGDGHQSTWTFDSYNNGGSPMSSADAILTTDALGNTSQAAYTSLNRVWCAVDAADYANGVRCPATEPTSPPSAGSGRSTSYLGAAISYFDQSGNVTAVTDARGYTNITKYTTSGLGVPVELPYCTVDATEYSIDGVTCPAYNSSQPGATTSTFNSSGEVLSQTTAIGDTTQYSYTDSAYPSLATRVTDATTGTVTTNTYDAAGRLIESTEGSGAYSASNVTAYDTAGRAYCTIAPLGYSQGASCPTPPSGPPARGTDPWPGTSITIFDADSRPIYQVNPLGGVTQTAYDEAGHTYCTVAPANYAAGTSCPSTPPTSAPTGTVTGYTTTIYDAQGRTVSVTDAIGDTTSSEYDTAGNLISQTSTPTKTANDPPVTTDYVYDADNHQITSCVNADGLAKDSPGSCSFASGTSATSANCTANFGAGTPCLVGDNAGAVLTASGAWTQVDGTNSITGTSCASSFCVVVDALGNAVSYSGSSWASPQAIDQASLTSVSCVSASFCIATDALGRVLSFNGSSWSASPLPVDQDEVSLTSSDCLSTTDCLAVDANGNLFTYNGTSWSTTPTQIDQGHRLTGLSCTSTSYCVAVDNAGNAITFNGTSWIANDVDGTNALTAVSCVDTSNCAAVDSAGNVIQWDGTSWTQVSLGGGFALTSVACTSGSPDWCDIYDANGNVFVWLILSGGGGVWTDSPLNIATTKDKTTRTTYDPNGHAYCSVSANAAWMGPVTPVAYWGAYQCPSWQASWIALPPSPSSLYSYTPSASQADGVTMSFYDTNGNLVQQTTPGLAGDQATSGTPDISTTVNAYDPNGRPYCSADATNVASYLGAHPSSTYPYLCPSSPPSSAPTGLTTGYTTTIYDAAGNQLSVTDQVGDTTSYTYDAAGDKMTMVDPRSETTSYCYWYQNAPGQCAASGGWWQGSGFSGAVKSVSCPANAFCAAANGAKVGIWNGSTWTTTTVDSSHTINAVSCVSASFCVAADGSGRVFTYNGSAWSAATDIDGSTALKAVSCASAVFCVAADGAGNVLTYSGSAWSSASNIDGTKALSAVSCASTSFCVAADASGRVLTYNASSWSAAMDIDGTKALKAVSCPTSSFCVVADGGGNVLTYAGASWSSADSIDGASSINGVACVSASFCIAVDSTGSELLYNGTGWTSAEGIDGNNAFNAVSCASVILCEAVSAGGQVLTYVGAGPANSPWSMTTPATSSDPSGELTTYTYLAGGQTSTKTTPSGATTDDYDSTGDVTATLYASSSGTPPANLSFTYNQDQTRHTMTDGTGTTTYAYDDVGDQTQAAFSATLSGLVSQTVGYGYDAQGSVGSVTYPSFGTTSNPTVTYSYAADGTMASVSDWAGHLVTFGSDAYTAHNAEAKYQAFPDWFQNNNGTSITSFRQDLSGRSAYVATNVSASAMAQATCASPGSVTQQLSAYTLYETAYYNQVSNGSRNPNGQVTEDYSNYADNCNNTVNVERNYSYDQAGRVVYQGSVAQGGSANSFAYDASGDPTTISSHDASGNLDTYTQTFDAAGETLSQTPIAGSNGAASTYTYNLLGAQKTASTSGQAESFYYYNQLAQMTEYTKGFNIVYYNYTGDGLEASASYGSAVSQMIWDTASSSVPLALSDGTNYYIYGPNDTPVEQFNITSSPPANNPVFMSYVPDNSSWIVTSASGQALNYYRYDAYGNLSNGQAGSPFGYAGQYTDNVSPTPTGFSNMRARWYEPQMGAFQTRDPQFDVTGHAYTYASADPVNGADPTGMYPVGTTHVGGWTTIRRAGSNSCIDDSNWSQSAGNRLWLWPCVGNSNQQWRVLIGYPNALDAIFEFSVAILQNMTSSMCLDVWYDSGANFTPAVQWPCNLGDGAQWIGTSLNTSWNVGYSGSFVIHEMSVGTCLDDPYRNTAPGTYLEFYECNQTIAQAWIPSSQNPSWWSLTWPNLYAFDSPF